jgi:cytochrome b561
MLEARIDEPGYGTVAKTLHWLILSLLVVQFMIAWTMPDIEKDTRPDMLINLHLSMGIAILLLAGVRALWRFIHPVPLLVDGMPAWQHRSAQATHALLYALVIIIPLMGWANASARGWTIDLFGIGRLPPLVPKGTALGTELGGAHAFLSTVLLVLVGLHVAAALYHHFWLKDRVLLRMLPRRR